MLTDKLTSHDVSLRLSVVDASHNIREEFINFIQLDRITGEHIAVGLLLAKGMMVLQT